MNWDQIVTKDSPYIARIESPAGHGTGFLCLYNEDKSWFGIATAMHGKKGTRQIMQLSF